MCNSNSKKLLNRTFYGVTLIGKISRFPKNDRKLISSSLRIIFVSVKVTLPDWELTTQSSVQGFWTVWNWTFKRMLSQSKKVEALPRITAKKSLAILQSKLYISLRQHQMTKDNSGDLLHSSNVEQFIGYWTKSQMKDP